MSKPFKDRTRSHRKKTKQQLLDIADEIKYRHFDDGRITGIDVFRRRALIHRSTAFYTFIAGYPRLVRATGKFIEEIFRDAAARQTIIIQNPIMETRHYYTGDVNVVFTAGEEKTFLDLKGVDAELQTLEFSSNTKSGEIQIFSYASDGILTSYDLEIKTKGTGRVVIDDDGGGNFFGEHEAINDNESIIFYQLKYDVANSLFKMGLGYNIRFANGVKIILKNGDAAAKSLNCMAFVLIRS